MSKKSTSTSAKPDTTRPANLSAFASAFTALQWGANDACDSCHDCVGNTFAALLVNDLGATIEAIEGEAPDLRLDALEHDYDRLVDDFERMGLRKEGPGIVMLLRFVLDQIKVAA